MIPAPACWHREMKHLRRPLHSEQARSWCHPRNPKNLVSMKIRRGHRAAGLIQILTVQSRVLGTRVPVYSHRRLRRKKGPSAILRVLPQSCPNPLRPSVSPMHCLQATQVQKWPKHQRTTCLGRFPHATTWTSLGRSHYPATCRQAPLRGCRQTPNNGNTPCMPALPEIQAVLQARPAKRCCLHQHRFPFGHLDFVISQLLFAVRDQISVSDV